MIKIIEVLHCGVCMNYDVFTDKCSILNRKVEIETDFPEDCPLPDSEEYSESNFNIDKS